ncbi:hypothetical protein AGMMS49944_27810 [Spirochaetia bacterium]|nr:hypothetical protein AGMMS49944_27810 [Spirochaetia bacterium]
MGLIIEVLVYRGMGGIVKREFYLLSNSKFNHEKERKARNFA